jgi:hypothetical protein
LISGISSLLSSWIRIKNNNISSSSFLELVNGLLENSRSLSVVCEQLVLEIERGENVKSWFWPKVKLFCIERGRSSEKFASLIEYPSLMLFDGDDTKEEYVLVADTSIHPDPGIIYCMVSMMLREKNIAGCCAKIMNSDDTVNHAGYILQKDASLKSHAMGNSRFSKAATEVVNIDSAEPLLVIFRRSVVEELLLDKFDKESILALKKKNHSLIYCPDAEAYA